MASQIISNLTEEEYLRRERAADYKSEYVGGEAFAMAGGSSVRSELAVAFLRELSSRLVGRCRVFNSDLRVRTDLSGAYVYPDASAVCGKVQYHSASKDILINPKLIVEVLSPSTADYDRGKKFDLYREIPSFEEYLLCHQDTIRIEQFTRQPDNSWVFRDHRELSAILRLSSVGCEITLKDIYADIVNLA